MSDDPLLEIAKLRVQIGQVAGALIQIFAVLNAIERPADAKKAQLFDTRIEDLHTRIDKLLNEIEAAQNG